MTLINITSGACCGQLIKDSSVSGEVFVWHDVLYDGPGYKLPQWINSEHKLSEFVVKRSS